MKMHLYPKKMMFFCFMGSHRIFLFIQNRFRYFFIFNKQNHGDKFWLRNRAFSRDKKKFLESKPKKNFQRGSKNLFEDVEKFWRLTEDILWWNFLTCQKLVYFLVIMIKHKLTKQPQIDEWKKFFSRVI